MADTITPILPTSPLNRARLDSPVQAVATTKIANITSGAAAGAEVNLQVLLRVTSIIAKDQSADAANPNPSVREFKDAPITYDGFGNSQRISPTEISRMFLVV